MDEIDAANEQAEKWLNLHIKAARGVPLVVQGDGVCLSCGEPSFKRNGIIGRWCSYECRDDYDKIKKY